MTKIFFKFGKIFFLKKISRQNYDLVTKLWNKQSANIQNNNFEEKNY